MGKKNYDDVWAFFLFTRRTDGTLEIKCRNAECDHDPFSGRTSVTRLIDRSRFANDKAETGATPLMAEQVDTSPAVMSLNNSSD